MPKGSPGVPRSPEWRAAISRAAQTRRKPITAIRRCFILGCTGQHKAHGLCKTHLGRKLRKGDPLYERPLAKGGINTQGYVVLSIPKNHPRRSMVPSGRILEHRYVMAEHLGRDLEPWETVHHINGIRTDNRIENLQLRVGQHGRGAAHKCLDCGSQNIAPVDLERAA